MADKPDDLLDAAKEAIEQAKTLAGNGKMSDREFLESMSRSDAIMDHPDCMEPSGTCGFCMTQYCFAEAARRLLAEGDVLDGINKWTELSRRMWHETKYYKLYQEEHAAGRNPSEAFAARGWEM